MRESINISLTDSLRRANVRPRLDALADSTGFAAAQIAGRALLLGLQAIEKDWNRLFPASDPDNPTTPSETAQRYVAPDVAPVSHAAPCETTRNAESQRSAAPHMEHRQTTQQRDEQPDPAPLSTAQPEPDPLPSAPHLVSTQEAAQLLGHGTADAFRQHVQRHEELRQHGRKSGRAMLWDLPELRIAYARLGFRLRGQGIAQEDPQNLGPGEPATA